MITRKVDRQDSRAGHTYSWVKAIAEKLDGRLYVVCLEKGDCRDLPVNVVVDSLGTEHGVSRLVRWLRFPSLFWRRVRGVGAVFCHQNPEYAIAAWLCGAKLRGRKLVAWYTHGTVSWKTRWMARVADVVLTASAESFRIDTPKRKIVGHGIDTEQFQSRGRNRKLDPAYLRIVSVGRISPTKDYATLIEAMAKIYREQLLQTSGGKPVKARLVIVGAPALPSDQEYFATLQSLIRKIGLTEAVEFVGPVPHAQVSSWFQSEHADLMVNMSGTGSVDKAVLEAMACGCPVITSNAAFRGIVPHDLIVPPNDPLKLVQKIVDFFHRFRDEGVNLEYQLSRRLRLIVEQSHSLDHLVKEILAACTV